MSEQSNRGEVYATALTTAPPEWRAHVASAPRPVATPLWPPPPAWSPPSPDLANTSSPSLSAPSFVAQRRGNRQKQSLLIVLSFVLVILVLAVGGVTTYGIASMRHSASPPKRTTGSSPIARASSISPDPSDLEGGETVAEWWVGAQGGLLNIAGDLFNMGRAGQGVQLGSFGTACKQLATDAEQLQNGSAPPAASVNEPFQSAMSDLEKGGTECTNGLSAYNTSDLHQAETDIENAGSQIQKMYASLGNYLPPGSITAPSIPTFSSD